MLHPCPNLICKVCNVRDSKHFLLTINLYISQHEMRKIFYGLAYVEFCINTWTYFRIDCFLELEKEFKKKILNLFISRVWRKYRKAVLITLNSVIQIVQFLFCISNRESLSTFLPFTMPVYFTIWSVKFSSTVWWMKMLELITLDTRILRSL